jgi:erythromycin esterase-like protein
MDVAVRDTSVPINEAMARGLYPIWANSAQVLPVFEYARSVAGTRRPLEMIGFDHQFSGMRSSSRWRDALLAFVDAVDSTILPMQLRSGLANNLRDIVFKQDSKSAEIRLVEEKWRALPRLLDSTKAKLLLKHSETEFALIRRSVDDVLLSIEGIARMRDAAGAFNAADNNLRDQRMGENLVWLAKERYKDRRIIVWAASFHTLHEASAIKLDSGSTFSYQGVLTMGQVVRKSLNEAIYTIAFTAAEGKAGDATGGRALDLEAPADSSFEGLCVTLGHQFLLVDLQHLPASHWLRQPISASALGYSPITTDWSRQVDAFIFIRTMFPSTKGPMAPEGAVLTEHESPMRKIR